MKRKSYARTIGKYARMATGAYSAAKSYFGRHKYNVGRSNRVSTRFKYRGGGSRTRTQQNRKKQVDVVATDAGTVSSYRIKRRIPRGLNGGMIGMLAKQSALYNESGRISQGPGVQSLGVPLIAYSYAKHNFGVGFLDHGVATAGDSRVWLKDCNARTRFSNQSPVTCEMVIYDIICRRDTLGGKNDPLQVWQQGAIDVGGIAADCNQVNSYPTDYSLFGRQCKILQRKRVILAAGETHEHIVHLVMNKIMCYDVFMESAGGMKGLTFYTMVAVTGFPDNDSLAKTSVSTGTTAIDFVTSYRYHWSVLSNSKGYNENHVLIPSSFANAEEVMQEYVGNVNGVNPS